MFHLARKSNLAYNLKLMQKEFPDSYDFFPKTWMLPSEMGEFKNHFRVIYQISKLIPL